MRIVDAPRDREQAGRLLDPNAHELFTGTPSGSSSATRAASRGGECADAVFGAARACPAGGGLPERGRNHCGMSKLVLAVIVSCAIGLAAAGIARGLGHPWMHNTLIGLGAGCVTLALGLWWASRRQDAPVR